ncbi:hypothetical protein SLE2022_182790 [Rubroshorea leprosula]
MEDQAASKANHHVFDVSLDVLPPVGANVDGRLDGTGTVWTTSAHIITAVMGSGVVSLTWAVAQLGWIIGPAAILSFSFLTDHGLQLPENVVVTL